MVVFSDGLLLGEDAEVPVNVVVMVLRHRGFSSSGTR